MKKNSAKTVNDSAKRIIRFEVLNSQRTAAVIDFDKILKGIPIKGLSIVRDNNFIKGYDTTVHFLRIKTNGLVENEILEISNNRQTTKPGSLINVYQNDLTRLEIIDENAKIADYKIKVAGWSVCYITFFISSKR